MSPKEEHFKEFDDQEHRGQNCPQSVQEIPVSLTQELF